MNPMGRGHRKTSKQAQRPTPATKDAESVPPAAEISGGSPAVSEREVTAEVVDAATEPGDSPAPPQRTEQERVQLEREAESLETRLTEVRDRLLANTNAEVNGLFQILGSKRRLLMVNFLAGLARGLGFFLGVTLVGALLVGGSAYLLDATAQGLGLDDVTTIGMVEPIFHKFREVETLWGELQEEADDPPPVRAGYIATPFGLVWTGNGEPPLPTASEDAPTGDDASENDGN